MDVTMETRYHIKDMQVKAVMRYEKHPRTATIKKRPKRTSVTSKVEEHLELVHCRNQCPSYFFLCMFLIRL